MLPHGRIRSVAGQEICDSNRLELAMAVAAALQGQQRVLAEGRCLASVTKGEALSKRLL